MVDTVSAIKGVNRSANTLLGGNGDSLFGCVQANTENLRDTFGSYDGMSSIGHDLRGRAIIGCINILAAFDVY